MRQRCFNPKNKKYPSYGGRGITICSGLSTFRRFIGYLGLKPGDEYSLDRINNDKGYYCGDCIECLENRETLNLRWATAKQQANNRRPHPNKTGFPGVQQAKGKYWAQIWFNDTNKRIGPFSLAEEAHQAYLLAKEIRKVAF